MLTKANTLVKKPKLSLEEYLDSRIKEASEGGYPSAKAWLDNDKLSEAQIMLKSSGYKVSLGTSDINRTQLVIEW